MLSYHGHRLEYRFHNLLGQDHQKGLGRNGTEVREGNEGKAAKFFTSGGLHKSRQGTISEFEPPHRRSLLHLQGFQPWTQAGPSLVTRLRFTNHPKIQNRLRAVALNLLNFGIAELPTTPPPRSRRNNPAFLQCRDEIADCNRHRYRHSR
jgi:hypothetical protein